MPSTERWLLIHTSTPAPISSRAISAWISENPIAKSGFNFRISPILALVNAETFGFSLRARPRARDHMKGIPKTPPLPWGGEDQAARPLLKTNPRPPREPPWGGGP